MEQCYTLKFQLIAFLLLKAFANSSPTTHLLLADPGGLSWMS